MLFLVICALIKYKDGLTIEIKVLVYIIVQKER